MLAIGCAAQGTCGAAPVGVSTDPIAINGCRIVAGRSFVSAYKPIVLAFTNRSASSADLVRFSVVYAGRVERITDKGTFLQNVRIEHAFDGFYNVPYAGPTPSSCRVEYVDFSDGSAWTASPAPAPSTSERIIRSTAGAD